MHLPIDDNNRSDVVGTAVQISGDILGLEYVMHFGEEGAVARTSETV